VVENGSEAVDVGPGVRLPHAGLQQFGGEIGQGLVFDQVGEDDGRVACHAGQSEARDADALFGDQQAIGCQAPMHEAMLHAMDLGEDTRGIADMAAGCRRIPGGHAIQHRPALDPRSQDIDVPLLLEHVEHGNDSGMPQVDGRACFPDCARPGEVRGPGGQVDVTRHAAHEELASREGIRDGEGLASRMLRQNLVDLEVRKGQGGQSCLGFTRQKRHHLGQLFRPGLVGKAVGIRLDTGKQVLELMGREDNHRPGGQPTHQARMPAGKNRVDRLGLDFGSLQGVLDLMGREAFAMDQPMLAIDVALDLSLPVLDLDDVDGMGRQDHRVNLDVREAALRAGQHEVREDLAGVGQMPQRAGHRLLEGIGRFA